MTVDQQTIDEQWMRQAIAVARRAEQAGEVPVGAVIVRDNQLIAEGWNCPIGTHDPSAHAEIVALRKAGKAIGNYRLLETTLYVTLEPCVMCSGALYHARVARVVYGARDPKAGAAGSMYDTLLDERFNHRINVTGEVLAKECGSLLTNFFKARR
jgi:tRNA(adenine34) deaminase